MSGVINSFPGYEFIRGEDGKMHNMYKGTDLGFGGYVYSEPGMYRNAALIDCQSEHPWSIINLNYFGEYTKNYKDLLEARVCIKHRDFDKLSTLLDGKFTKYIGDEDVLATLDKVLKIPLNAAYGQTCARYDCIFRHKDNINNIVALRGALFMRDLQDAIKEQGYKVIHIKTDSVKIPDSDDYIVKFVQEFGKKYGYIMEHEATYDRICLVNNAVYIAKYDECGIRNKGGKHANEWTATGTQFQVPYVFKTLFSHEPIEKRDLCETKSVTRGGQIYLNFNEEMIAPYISEMESLKEELIGTHKGVMPIKKRIKELQEKIDNTRNLRFVGKCGLFTPVVPGAGGGILLRSTDETLEKFVAVTGTTGYRWIESELLDYENDKDKIDKGYFRNLVDEAYTNIAQYCDPEEFMRD